MVNIPQISILKNFQRKIFYLYLNEGKEFVFISKSYCFKNENGNVPLYPLFVKPDIEQQGIEAKLSLLKNIRNTHSSAISYQIWGQMSLFIDLHTKYMSRIRFFSLFLLFIPEILGDYTTNILLFFIYP